MVQDRLRAFEDARRDRGDDAPLLLEAAHPWLDPDLAELYDLFPFTADIPMYLAAAERAGGRILEIACGTGRVLVPLAEAGHDVTGLDASDAMLAIARRKLTARGEDVLRRVELRNADMRSFDVGHRYALAIVPARTFGYLQTVDEQLATLRSIARHLEPGGLLIVDLVNPTLEWLSEEANRPRRDLIEHLPEERRVVSRTEVIVSTDLAEQVRVNRSEYEIVSGDGEVRKRFVEWPFRFTFRHEAEHLLARAGFEVQRVSGGYRGEAFTGTSPAIVMEAAPA
jgi:SAM-dependent methyltransferase